jgi:hypothetical protein
MNGTGTLRVWMADPLYGETIYAGVPVTLRPLDQTTQGRKAVEPVISPITNDPSRALPLTLPSGEYELETLLPSGEVIYRTATVIENAAVDARLDPIGTSNERERWNYFGGSRHLTTKALALEPMQYGLTVPVQAETGSAVQTRLGPFNLSNWSEWFDYLGRRWEERLMIPPAEPEMRVAARTEHSLDVFYPTSPGPAVLEIKGASVHGDPSSIGQRHDFLLLSVDWGIQAVSLPMPWSSDSDARVSFSVLVRHDREQTIIDYSLADPQFGSLIAYLNNGRTAVAAALIPALRDALNGKHNYPLAAAASGYVQLATRGGARREDGSLPDQALDWLSDLPRAFPALPDAYVLLGKYHRDHARGEDAAHQLFYTAWERGVPFFSAGVTWLIEGLRQSAVACGICAKALHEVRSVAAYMDLTGAFPSFRLERPKPAAYDRRQG